MIEQWLRESQNGQPVWLPQVRAACAARPDSVPVILQLTLCSGEQRDFTLYIPAWQGEEQRQFAADYLHACVYNLMAALGGRELRFFLDLRQTQVTALLEDLDRVFQVHAPSRSSYGKCVNVADRMSAAFGGGSFAFVISDISAYHPAAPAAPEPAIDLAARLRETAARTQKGAYCGVDVGGTDVKVAGAYHGRLVCLKEYDWNPAACTTAGEILTPLLRLVRLTRACLAQTAAGEPLDEALTAALDHGASDEAMEQAIQAAEDRLGDRINILDGVGLSYPDVVIRNRIVGGETPKTKGIRENPAVDYRVEFAKLTDLRLSLLALCRAGGQVQLTNDGPMAAYTAAMELAHSAGAAQIGQGVLAHSLGTDLGTGWLTATGQIPELPLELYDFLMDLGSRPYRNLPLDDLRGVCNENSGLPGVRRYLGQAAAFRLAALTEPRLLEGFTEEKNGVLFVPTSPEDLRKPCLEHLMTLAEDRDPAAEAIFRQIGAHLGQVSLELEYLLHPQTPVRFLFGRFIKKPHCFALLQEGCREVFPGLTLEAANEELACTPLMTQLAARPDATVAQFGQAIGAVYFCCL